jgi:threonylcarbamoyladenosine tRNA methylthiotransferase MtaB
MATPYKTVAFHTLGCKLNYAEASTLARNFNRYGYVQVNFQDSADIYVINSCSVTDNADKKARQAVRQVLKRSPSAKIAIVGCYAQLKPEEISQIPGVNIVAGTGEKFNLPHHIESNRLNGEAVVLNTEIESADTFIPSYSLGHRTRSFLKIQDGCNYACSFCTIPLARGKSRSATVNQAVAIAEKIAAEGALELVLTGVNVGDFGILNDETLIDLIQKLEKVEGIHRYRISSIEPNLLTNEIICFMGESEKFLPHFHIPLQSGSNKILKAMRRRYQTDLFAERIYTIKSILPDAGIGVDVIVGFPGESDKDFQQTYNFLETIDVSYLHVFSFSERDHTDAVNISPKVKPETILERSQIIQGLSSEKKNKFYKQNIGSVREVLIESCKKEILSGLTENYIRIHTVGNPEEVNTIIPLQMQYIQGEVMRGTRVS